MPRRPEQKCILRMNSAFLKLPGEIRNRVYELVVQTTDEVHIQFGEPIKFISHALACTSRQVRREFHALFTATAFKYAATAVCHTTDLETGRRRQPYRSTLRHWMTKQAQLLEGGLRKCILMTNLSNNFEKHLKQNAVAAKIQLNGHRRFLVKLRIGCSFKAVIILRGKAQRSRSGRFMLKMCPNDGYAYNPLAQALKKAMQRYDKAQKIAKRLKKMNKRHTRLKKKAAKRSKRFRKSKSRKSEKKRSE